MTDNVTNLFDGDRRALKLLNALEEAVKENAADMPVPTVLGVCDLLKDLVKEMPRHE